MALVAEWDLELVGADGLGKERRHFKNLIVNAGLFAAGVWARNLIVLLASGAAPGEMMSSLLLWSTLQAITTALVGVVVVVMFRNWLAIRLDE